MMSIRDVSHTLLEQQRKLRLTQVTLREQAGVSNRTLQQVLSGTADYKLSTLLAIADRLGLELLLVPKGAVAGLAQAADAPAIQTHVQAALSRVMEPKP